MFTHYTNTSSYVIIPKPHLSSREGINSRCRLFAQSFTAMIAVVAHVVAGDRSIDRDRHIQHTLGLRGSFWMFFAYKKIARLN